MDYASLGDLKGALGITDNVDDALLQVALDATKSAIDDHCNRTFDPQLDATTRYYDPVDGIVHVDDIYTKDGLIVSVGGSVVDAAVSDVSAGYVLLPANAEALKEPWTAIQYGTFGKAITWPLLFAVRGTQTKVTAKWGYAAVIPPAVRQACLLQASRLFTRRHSPYGIAGSPDLGSELRLLSKLDPDVAVLLAGKVRYQ